MKEKRASFSSGELELEGVLHLPAEEGSFPGVVVCHPHPLYGGDMNNNVVVALCQALAERAIIALRFNFRGVGRSQGSFAQGIGEREDARAALTFLAATASRLGLGGYSFGAMVAIGVAEEESRVEALVLISPPLQPPPLEGLRNLARPKLIVCGSADPFIPSSQLHSQIEERASAKLKIVPGADHFWWGHEEILAHSVVNFFTRHLIGKATGDA